MKLVIERSELLRALAHVTSVVERRTTIPILSNVLLKASGQALELKATDLEREVVDQAAADVSQPGAVTVPAHILHDIVRKLPDGAEVEIKRDAEKERLTLSSGQSRFALQTLAPEDFPDLAAGEFSHSFEIAASDLRRLIDKTRFAISTEETRYYLNGIYLHTAARGKQPTLRAVATDGHRLAQAELISPKGSDGMPGIILPRKTVHELHRLMEDSAETVQVGVSSSKARFAIGTITLTSKLIDGTFPDYGRVIPKSNDILDTLGWILVEQGNTTRGLPLLQKAASLAPDLTEIRYHFVLGLVKAGDKAKARKELEQLLATGKDFPDINKARTLLQQI